VNITSVSITRVSAVFTMICSRLSISLCWNFIFYCFIASHTCPLPLYKSCFLLLERNCLSYWPVAQPTDSPIYSSLEVLTSHRDNWTQLLLFNFLIFYAVSRTPWTGDQPITRLLPAHKAQHRHIINAYRHPCHKWDLNPWSQCLSGQRWFMP
jgi:hypothetical protein